jgi:phosphoribosylanthranilate isomerase
MKVKVCGMTNMQQIKELEEMSVDFAGLIFHKPSPRYVMNGIASPSLFTNENIRIKKVGVFVNESVDTVLRTAKEWRLDMVQLHGDESPEFCKKVRLTISASKVFRVGQALDFNNVMAYNNVVDYFLFDTLGEQYGGTGNQFDWKLLSSLDLKKPYFLSGGIGSEDVQKIDNFCKLQTEFYSLDLNSKFETTPGLKDMEKIRQFLSKIKTK